MAIASPPTEQVVPLTLLLGVPSKCQEIEGSIESVLTQVPQSPYIRLPEEVVPLKVVLTMNGRSEVLTRIEEHFEKGAQFRPDDFQGMDRPAGGIILPYKVVQAQKINTFDVRIRVPKNAHPGSIYYLRIAQNISGQITGGYTIVIRVTK